MADAEGTKNADLIPVTDYRFPSLPVASGLQVLWIKLKELFQREQQKPLIRDDRLRGVPVDRLDEAAAPPACGPVVDELDSHLREWLRDETSSARLQVIVLPPCDQSNLIREWARQQKVDILTPPPRDRMGDETLEMPDLDGEGVLVIPTLEHWFIRNADGLEYIRQLVDRIAASPRRILVGCNSWAWRYLVKALNINAVLPEPKTFAAFDAGRLQNWFREIARSHDGSAIGFVDPRTGDEILDENDGSPHKRLVELAARSLGIPWVAWHLWRLSLRDELTDDDADDEEVAESKAATKSRERKLTLWVVALEEYSLPNQVADDSLLILHSLLLHGGLSHEQLLTTVPFTGSYNTVNGLLASGINYREDNGDLCCSPEAYPAIRRGLEKAGFPVAAI